jgi:hypothetical protein
MILSLFFALRLMFFIRYEINSMNSWTRRSRVCRLTISHPQETFFSWDESLTAVSSEFPVPTRLTIGIHLWSESGDFIFKADRWPTFKLWSKLLVQDKKYRILIHCQVHLKVIGFQILN